MLVDAENNVVDRQLAKTRNDGPAAVAEHVGRLLAKLDPDGGIDSVGVGTPGVIVGSTVEQAVNLRGWDGAVDFGQMLVGTTGRRVVLGNDVAMALAGEHRCGSAVGVENVLAISVGTGVGGSLILDGEARSGPRGFAGEVGHVEVAVPSDNVPMCACGTRGHLEAYLGRASLERRARSLHASGTPTLLIDLAGEKRMTSSVWLDALEAGDELAHRLLDDATNALAVAITSAVTMLDLELVVLGGGFASRLGKGWRNRVEALHAERMTIGAPARLVGSGIGDNAAALGAALMSAEP